MVLGLILMEDNWNLPKLARSIIAELVGTFLLIYVGCGGVHGALEMATGSKLGSDGLLQIAFAFGLGIGVSVHLFSDISGGQFNPAVSFALFFAGKQSLVASLIFTVAQLGGGLIGCGILHGLLGYCPGAVELNSDISVFGGYVIEFFGTCFLVLTVLATTNEKRGHPPGFLQPLSIGLCIFSLHMFMVPTTGCGLNPARSFVTNFVAAKLGSDFHLWIIAPMLSSAAGAFLYKYVLDPHYKTQTHIVTENLAATKGS